MSDESPSLLPYTRKPAYLSPSSLHQLERDSYDFYLRRCGPEEAAPPGQLTDVAMVVGTLFDARVKVELAKEVGCPCPTLADLVATVDPSAVALIPEADKVAVQLLSAYKTSGAFKALIKEGLAEVHLSPGKATVPGTTRSMLGREVGGVPLGGFPDARIQCRKTNRRVVLDWKTTSKVSPEPGWTRCFNPFDVTAQYKPPHERSGEPFEALHPEWATQLVTYAWLLGIDEDPLPVAIDQVVYGSKDVRVFQFRGEVSWNFQVHLRERYRAAWEKITSERLVDPEVARQLLATPEHLRGLM